MNFRQYDVTMSADAAVNLDLILSTGHRQTTAAGAATTAAEIRGRGMRPEILGGTVGAAEQLPFLFVQRGLGIFCVPLALATNVPLPGFVVMDTTNALSPGDTIRVRLLNGAATVAQQYRVTLVWPSADEVKELGAE